jgi:calcineurin-like phosphoesterase family protein
MSIFFWSDPHFGHENVIRYCKRPYKDAPEMNESLIRNYNSVVGPNDTVICLGDFALGLWPVEKISERLNGHKELVPGNHDWCHPANRKTKKGKLLDKWIKYYESFGWKVRPIFDKLDVPGVATFNMCHMPYKGDSTDERYQDYRIVDDGRWLICGHVHEKWLRKGRMINVGVDVNNYKPIPLDGVVEIMGMTEEQVNETMVGMGHSVSPGK